MAAEGETKVMQTVDLNRKCEAANLLEYTIRVFSWPWDKKSPLEITEVLTKKKLTIHRNHKEKISQVQKTGNIPNP